MHHRPSATAPSSPTTNASPPSATWIPASASSNPRQTPSSCPSSEGHDMSKPLVYIACYATVHLHERKYINPWWRLNDRSNPPSRESRCWRARRAVPRARGVRASPLRTTGQTRTTHGGVVRRRARRSRVGGGNRRRDHWIRHGDHRILHLVVPEVRPHGLPLRA